MFRWCKLFSLPSSHCQKGQIIWWSLVSYHSWSVLVLHLCVLLMVLLPRSHELNNWIHNFSPTKKIHGYQSELESVNNSITAFRCGLIWKSFKCTIMHFKICIIEDLLTINLLILFGLAKAPNLNSNSTKLNINSSCAEFFFF